MIDTKFFKGRMDQIELSYRKFLEDKNEIKIISTTISPWAFDVSDGEGDIEAFVLVITYQS